jgi:hypothetical protein
VNPNAQTQIFDVLRGQWVQADGGEMFTASVLFQILVELRIANDLTVEQSTGRIPSTDLDARRKDLVNEILTFTRQS